MASNELPKAAVEAVKSIIRSQKIKYLLFAIIFLFITIIVIINITSYANILSKSGENPSVPKTRARSGLIVNIVLLILLLGFCVYYFYRFSDNSGIFSFGGLFPFFKSKSKIGFPVVADISTSPCRDARPIFPPVKDIGPVDLKPKKCLGNCQTSDPRTPSDCKGNYSAQGILKSF